jgi:hypothetical protein
MIFSMSGSLPMFALQAMRFGVSMTRSGFFAFGVNLGVDCCFVNTSDAGSGGIDILDDNGAGEVVGVPKSPDGIVRGTLGVARKIGEVKACKSVATKTRRRGRQGDSPIFEACINAAVETELFAAFAPLGSGLEKSPTRLTSTSEVCFEICCSILGIG